MSRDEAAEIVFLVGTLAIAAERGLSGLLKVSHLRPAQFRLLFAVHLEARRRLEGRAGRGMSDLEPRLTRQGYSVKVLAEQFHARPLEISRSVSRVRAESQQCELVARNPSSFSNNSSRTRITVSNNLSRNPR